MDNVWCRKNSLTITYPGDLPTGSRGMALYFTGGVIMGDRLWRFMGKFWSAQKIIENDLVGHEVFPRILKCGKEGRS